MNKDAVNVAESLRLGVEAARSGKNAQARTYLATVLKQDPHNIPALFWSAYIAPSPQESMTLLERVLALDPANERAQAGLEWARKRLNTQAASPVAPESVDESEAEPEQSSSTADPVETKPAPAENVEQSPEMPDEFIREQLLARKDVRKQAKKGALAHRARRTIDPLLVVIFILAAAIVLTLGVWIAALTPAETLAAWLPVPTENVFQNSGETSAPELLPATVPALLDENADVPAAQNFASASDAIVINTPLPVKSGGSEVGVSTPIAGVPPAAEALPQQAVSLSIEPGELIGPNTTNNETVSPSSAVNEATPPTEENKPPEVTSDISEAQPVEEESSTENSVTGNQPGEVVESADEVFDGVKLFDPVDESLLPRKPAYPDEKWIEVDVTLQQITAWEGNVPVMHFIGSTGLPGTPTVLGEYNVYWKLEKTLMTGADYYLPDVPYTMYFYRGYAIHGTYWHDNFGQPMSHGCVNLRTEEAKQIFEWADPPLPAGQTQVVSTYDNPGTLVFVHD